MRRKKRDAASAHPVTPKTLDVDESTNQKITTPYEKAWICSKETVIRRNPGAGKRGTNRGNHETRRGKDKTELGVSEGGGGNGDEDVGSESKRKGKLKGTATGPQQQKEGEGGERERRKGGEFSETIRTFKKGGGGRVKGKPGTTPVEAQRVKREGNSVLQLVEKG